MCGIAGIINKKEGKVSEDIIRQMTDKISHRGPDAEGIYVNDNYGVGHRRLAIIDTSTDGIQPMMSMDHKLIIAYNGEIYNYIEIKEKLKKVGGIFRTKTDTEVILEAYRIWGDSCVNEFNGMWAFAIYDVEEKKVFFSRDRFGVKPLYIYQTDRKFVFASEIKAILEVCPEAKDVNPVAIARFFRGIEEDADENTFYKNIKNFPKATNAIYDIKKNQFVAKQYWSVDKEGFRKKWRTRRPYRDFRSLFEDAIKIRMRSDVPVGASLSGGLDSSSIVCVAKKKFGISLKTFSSIYEEKECNEREFIDCVNDYVSADRYYIYPSKNIDIVGDLRKAIYFHDNPYECVSPYSGYCVYRGVGDNVKVMLDGQGADEVFSGYMDCIVAKINSLIDQNKFCARNKALRMIGAFQEAIPSYANIISESLMVALLGRRGYRIYTEKKTWENPRKSFVPGGVYTKEFEHLSTQFNPCYPKNLVNGLDRLNYYHLWYSFMPRILHDVDRNSMAHSLEVRLPFLDYRIVEFSYAIDDEKKIRNSWTKYIMRKSLKKYLPKKIYSRRNKMGFPAPIDAWLRDDINSIKLNELIQKFKGRHIFTEAGIDEIYSKHLKNEGDFGWILFKMISLEIWLEDVIDNPDYFWKLTDVEEKYAN